MPQTVTIDLPLVISPRGGLSLVRPIGFSDLALASANEATAINAVRRQVIKRCRHLVGKDLLRAVVRGTPKQQVIAVEFAAERKSAAWRDPIEVDFDTFQWQQEDAITIAYIPTLDLTVVATPQTDLEKLVQEQIRSSVRRTGDWSLPGLVRLHPTSGSSLQNQRIEVKTPTPAEYARKQQEEPTSKTPTLNSIATRLDRRSLRAAHHREDEVGQLARLLSADPPRSVLLVGPSGVGKTAIFHEWVRRRDEFGDPSLASLTCWSTDGSRLISGQSGFGMWQQQCLEMCEEAKRFNSIVHLGNLVELSESGRLHGSGGCGALLAPRLANGSLQAVIECTPEQLSRIERVEPRLVRALTILRVEEPTPEQTRSILLEAAANWRPRDISEELRRRRKRRRVRPARPRKPPRPLPVVEPEALQLLDRLHRRFRTDAAAPGRPLSFLHTVMSELDPGQTLDDQRVIEAFGRQTGLPKFLIDESVRPDLERIQQQLGSQVLGQETIIETLVDMIATLAADLSRGDRPLASMLLIGPTGVGKTETAKALARLIYSDVSRLVRIDMSELSTPAAVGRLIGDGLHPEGLLTSAVRAEPFSLVLLDEFEKAHWSVYDLLLQVLGEGRLTDGRGRLADFRNAIVLMTSNLGVDTFRAAPLGLADTQQKERYQSHFERQVRDFLRPEMFNRIDQILTYDPLQEATVNQITKLRLEEIRRRDGWQSQGDRFTVDDGATTLLTRRGYEPQYGARPLTREIEKSLVVPLAEAICESGRMSQLNADVTVADSGQPDRIDVQVSSDPPKAKESDISPATLVEEMTTLRRRSQAFERCDAVRRIRNQYTMTTRKLKAKLRTANSVKKKQKIRYGPLGAHRMQLREQIVAIDALCNDINAAEAELCARYYRGESIDWREAGPQIKQVRKRLWDKLCELYVDSTGESQRMTLIISGSNLVLAKVLLEAYQRLVKTREWNLQAHALLRRRPGSTMDRVLDVPGWSEIPAFRVSTERDKAATEDPAATSPQPSLAAYRLVKNEALTEAPAGTVALMMTFRGESAALMMGGEVGVHTFHRLQQSRPAGCSVLIAKHAEMPIEYVAPDWLARSEFQAAGQPRRWYDTETGLVHDMTDRTRNMKMDREGTWLEELVKQEMERRIWAMLDNG